MSDVKLTDLEIAELQLLEREAKRRRDKNVFDKEFYKEIKEKNHISLEEMFYDGEESEFIQVCSPTGEINGKPYFVETKKMRYCRKASQPTDLPNFQNLEEAIHSNLWNEHPEEFRYLDEAKRKEIGAELLKEFESLKVKYFFKIIESIVYDPETNYAYFGYTIRFSEALK